MAVAWLLTRRAIPPRFLDVLGAILIIALPALLVVVQPDLGTAIMLVVSGLLVLFLGGIRWQHLLMLIGAAVAAAPYLWAQLQLSATTHSDYVRSLVGPSWKRIPRYPIHDCDWFSWLGWKGMACWESIAFGIYSGEKY
ncbi:MAG: hypothetical protein Ct9H300mP14_09500 [Gammaproteobacteria bacterium]|nr:MAG: hypothetical protein Ct9H300mP14_09500 [Gammaproteobacteria bacterium]